MPNIKPKVYFQAFRGEEFVASDWLTITKSERGTGIKTNDVVFKREPDQNTWLDPKHTAVIDAWTKLEAALMACVETTR